MATPLKEKVLSNLRINSHSLLTMSIITASMATLIFGGVGISSLLLRDAYYPVLTRSGFMSENRETEESSRQLVEDIKDLKAETKALLSDNDSILMLGLSDFSDNEALNKPLARDPFRSVKNKEDSVSSNKDRKRLQASAQVTVPGEG